MLRSVKHYQIVRSVLKTPVGYEQGAYSQVLVMPSFTDDPKFSRIANDASYKGWSVSCVRLTISAIRTALTPFMLQNPRSRGMGRGSFQRELIHEVLTIHFLTINDRDIFAI